MTDSLFPSGAWTGFYNYHPGDRHRMDLQLTFASGVMSGEGRDDVGTFLIKGRYDAPSGECHWTKSYLGAHDVFYRGFREGKGIWGTWEITVLSHGGFHIWPRVAGEEQTASEMVRAGLAEAVASAEAPSTKHQDPERIQSPRSKFAGADPLQGRQSTPHGHELEGDGRMLDLGAWGFPGVWILELGTSGGASSEP